MAEDQFERYYAEKLWETIPAIYRHEDGIRDEPGVLRAIVQVLARQAAVLRRSQDRLWDDQFIDLCDEWAVPYLGDLVATRLLSDLNRRGRRIDVAKTIYYRRRKGTPRILEELISDISGWEGKLVEQFQKLGRSRHGLDPFPKTMAGRCWADLRNPRISELTNGPFEEYFHTPDMRRHAGLNGRYGIPKLAFYLYRLRAFQALNITPFALADGVSFSFDPSGRDIPLFSKRLRSPDWDWEEWHSAYEWEIPAPIPCRLLGHAEYSFGEEAIQQLTANGLSAAAADELRQLSGLRFKNKSSLITLIESFANSMELLNPANFNPLLAFALVADCGKQALLPDAYTIFTNPLESSSIVVGFESPANSIISAEYITAASLETWSYNADEAVAIDAERGRFQFRDIPDPVQTPYVSYHYGFSGPVGAGTYDRSWIKRSVPDQTVAGGGSIGAADLLNEGITRIGDSKTYGSIANKMSIKHLELQAANLQRPYIRMETNWILSSGPNLNATLILDGLWIGAAGDVEAAIIIRGNFECVVIRNCTFDPGGSLNANGENLLPLVLSIEGDVENLCIESSILGPIRLEGTGTAEEVSISDSIIQSANPAIKALAVNRGVTNLSKTTIYGSIDVHRLRASETLLTDPADVTDTQNGCFRFSAAPADSRLPGPYESYLFTTDPDHWFTSRRFGDPGYAQLSSTAPEQIARGAENGSEMGVFSSLLNPIKMDGLAAKIGEYMPFGLIPIFINKT